MVRDFIKLKNIEVVHCKYLQDVLQYYHGKFNMITSYKCEYYSFVNSNSRKNIFMPAEVISLLIMFAVSKRQSFVNPLDGYNKGLRRLNTFKLLTVTRKSIYFDQLRFSKGK